MILARVLSADWPQELALAYARLGLPSAAREYLDEKLPHLTLLLTGLTRVEGRFLRALDERGQAPGVEEYPRYVSGDPQRRAGTGLLSGRREQFTRFRDQASGDPALAELVRAVDAALASVFGPPLPPVRIGDRLFPLGGRAYRMGIVNVTPDSFSDGGRYLDPGAAAAHGEALVAAGADLLDVGGESTRPGAASVDAEEEARRVVPVIAALRARVPVPISVDTTKAAVAQAAIDAGATLVNDISGLRFDPAMPGVIARAGAACCVMHIQGTPRTMQAEPRYEDVVAEVIAALGESVERARSAGIRSDGLLVDPGIGFGKTAAHNLTLLRRAGDLRVLGVPVLFGTSRKSFLGPLTGGKPAAERMVASTASAAVLAVLGGADFVRVHDVAETRDAEAVGRAIRMAREDA